MSSFTSNLAEWLGFSLATAIGLASIYVCVIFPSLWIVNQTKKILLTLTQCIKIITGAKP